MGVLSQLIAVLVRKGHRFQPGPKCGPWLRSLNSTLFTFNAEAGEFFDSITNTSILTLSDTTEIRFLDDTEVQESLIRAEFLFNFTNSIPRTFEVNFQFLNDQNEETYATTYYL